VVRHERNSKNARASGRLSWPETCDLSGVAASGPWSAVHQDRAVVLLPGERHRDVAQRTGRDPGPKSQRDRLMRLFLHIIAERGRAGRHGQKAPLTWIPETMTTGWKGIAADAWESPGWREAAREYHNVRGGHPLIVETPAEHLAQLRRLLCHGVSLNVACDELNRAARERSNEEPKTTYDAVVYEMRTYGIPQLSKPSCQRRLADLSATQIGTVMASLQATRNQYPKVNNELLKALGRIYSEKAGGDD
jgi:transposase